MHIHNSTGIPVFLVAQDVGGVTFKLDPDNTATETKSSSDFFSEFREATREEIDAFYADRPSDVRGNDGEALQEMRDAFARQMEEQSRAFNAALSDVDAKMQNVIKNVDAAIVGKFDAVDKIVKDAVAKIPAPVEK